MSVKYNGTITFDSVPVYGWLFDYWDQTDWISWHKKLISRYDRDRANEMFLKAWNDSPPFAANIGFRNSAWSSNSEFISYAKDNEFYDKLFDGLFGTIFKIQSTAISGTSDIVDAAGNIASSTKTFSSYILPVIFILGLVFLFFYFKKQKLI